MILSDEGIRTAIQNGFIEITPEPKETQYTSSAVDLTLGTQFQGWNHDVLNVQGSQIHLNLAQQKYQSTAKAYLKPFPSNQMAHLSFLRIVWSRWFCWQILANEFILSASPGWQLVLKAGVHLHALV